MNEAQQSKIVELMTELDAMATRVRNDWSEFDGRDLRKAIDIHLLKLAKVIGVEWQAYYGNKYYGGDIMEHNLDNFWPDENQREAMQESRLQAHPLDTTREG